MKKVEKDKAITLRKVGKSINEIARELGVSKASVSLWVRDIELSTHQKKRLSEQGRSTHSVELRRTNRLRNELASRRVRFDDAASSIKNVSMENLFFLGTSLYWGEGSKTKRGIVNFTNSDPRSIQIMMRYFTEICEVPISKFRGHVILHPHLDSDAAIKYWNAISGIPVAQFYKTSMQHNKASKNKKDTLPLGTFSVQINDTILFLRIMGWIEGMYKNLIPTTLQVPCRYHVHL